MLECGKRFLDIGATNGMQLAVSVKMRAQESDRERNFNEQK